MMTDDFQPSPLHCPCYSEAQQTKCTPKQILQLRRDAVIQNRGRWIAPELPDCKPGCEQWHWVNSATDSSRLCRCSVGESSWSQGWEIAALGRTLHRDWGSHELCWMWQERWIPQQSSKADGGFRAWFYNSIWSNTALPVKSQWSVPASKPSCCFHTAEVPPVRSVLWPGSTWSKCSSAISGHWCHSLQAV